MTDGPLHPANPEHSKRDADRNNVVVYGSSPGNYLLQNPEAAGPQYQSQLLQLQPQVTNHSHTQHMHHVNIFILFKRSETRR